MGGHTYKQGHGRDLVAGSPSDSIATKHGGSVKKLSHTSHPGGKPKHGGAGHKHGPSGKKM